MRIAIVVHYFTPFYKQNEYGLGKSLASLGHDVTLITSNRKMKKFYHKSREFKIGRKKVEKTDNFNVVYLPTFLEAFEQPFMPTIISEILKEDYEIIHAHEDFQNCTFLSYIASRLRAKPFIFSEERYYYPSSLFQKSLYFSYAKVLCRIIQKGSAMITAHTNAAKKFLMDQGVPPQKVAVIPVGIDSQEFIPIEDPSFKESLRIADKPLILTVARLHPNKGLEYLVMAMKKILAKLPDAKLAIIGSGPLEEELRKLISSLNLMESIHLITDPIPNEKMPIIYPSADVFVLPSVKEPFGRVLLEAMACARPVIATRVAGPIDIVIDGETGLLVEPRNPEILAEKIIQVLQHSEYAKKLGKAGRYRVEEFFDWRKVAKRYVQVYTLALRKVGKNG